MPSPRKRILSSALLVIFLSGHLAILPQGLDDFKDDVEQEQGSGKRKTSSSKSSDGVFSTIGAAIFSAVAGVFAALWYDVNSAARFDKYPYATKDRKPIEFAPIEDDMEVMSGVTIKDDRRDLSAEQLGPIHDKTWFLNIQFAGQIQDSPTRAASAEINWRFTPVFGLFSRYRQFFEPGVESLHDARIGFEMAFIQAGFMQSAFQIGYTNWSGLLEDQGVSTGVEATFFPQSPLTINVLLGAVAFSDINFLELRPRLGFMLQRYEIFAGGYLLRSENSQMQGLEAGVRFWL